MSAIAAPLPQPSSYRPPIVPPTRTTYDGAPAPGEDSTQWLIRAATDLLARFRRRYAHDDVATSPLLWRMSLIRWRIWLQTELNSIVLIEEDGDLPPSFMAEAIQPGPLRLTDPNARRLSDLVTQFDDALREIDAEIAAQFSVRSPSEE